jgi:adhesin/invasin
MSTAKWWVTGALVLAALLGGIRLVTTAFADPVLTVTSALAQNYLPADGHSTTTLTATVTVGGVPQPNVSVSFGVIDGGDVTLSARSAVTNSSGQATTTVTASATLGEQTLTTTAQNVVADKTLTLYGAPAAISLRMKPSSITADGVSTSTAVIIVTDSNGDRVPGQTVTLTTTGSASITPPVDKGDGIYPAGVTASKKAQTETLTATLGTLTATGTLIETAGAPATASVALSRGSIIANGTSTSTATATVRDANGNLVPGATVGWSTSDPGAGVTGGSGVTDGSGTTVTTITASTRAQTATVTATVGGLTGTAGLTETNGPVTGIALTLGSSSIAANGTSTTTATVTLTDANGNPVIGVNPADPSLDGSIDFTTSVAGAAGVTFTSASQVATDGGGQATTTITSSTTPGPQTITATAHATAVNASAQLRLYGSVTSVTLGLTPASVPAGTASTATATALATDVAGDPVPGQSVVFATSSDATFCAGCTTTVVTGADGRASIGVNGTADTGPKPFTATTAGKTAGATLVVYGSPSHIALGLTPTTVVADGTTTITATATVTDAAQGNGGTGGNGVPGQTVSLTRNGATVGTATDNGDGTYTATITASTTAQTETLVATDAAITASPTSASASLTETAGPAATVSVALSAATVVADGAAQSTATASVADAHGNPVLSDTVAITTSGDATVGTVTANGDGTYTATITASTTADQETITATDAATSAAGVATLTERPGPPVQLTLSPAGAHLASGGHLSYTATGVDAFGNNVGDVTAATTFSIAPDGSCTGPVCTAGVLGTHRVTGTDGRAGGTATLQVQGPDTVTVTPHSHALTANGISHTTVAALVRDAAGNPVSGIVVTFSNGSGSTSSLSFTPPTATTDAGGVASTVATASTHAGTVILTAGEDAASGTATERLTGARFVAAGFSAGRVAADGSSSTTATAQVVDGSGAPVPGETVTFASGGPTGPTVAHPSVVTDAGGNATDQVTSSTYGGSQPITVTDASSDVTADQFSVVLTLTQTATNGSFVHAAYQTMLGRDADTSSFSYWLGRLDGGTPRGSLALALARSAEYRTNVIGGTVASGVPDFYQLYLHRAADPGGIQYWVGRMAGIGGSPLSFEQVRLQFVGSWEYFNVTNNGDPGTIIDALYHDLLGRAAEPAGKSYWLTHFDVNTIARQFLFSVEGRQVLVEGYYSSILHRTFDRAGLDYWTRQLLTGASDENIIADFLSSDEYFQSH